MPRPRIVEAYLYFYEEALEYADDKSNEEYYTPSIERIEALVDAITKRMELVLIELEERDNPQVIFETLNALGEPLLPSDLIRNFVFLEATRRVENVDSLYSSYWKQYDEPVGSSSSFWKHSEKQGRLSRPRIDLFMFHYLVCKTEHEFLITHIFPEFRMWWNRSWTTNTTVESQLQEIQRHSEVFKNFFSTANNSRFDLFLSRLRVIDTSTIFPLLLFWLMSRTSTDGQGQR